MKNVKEFYILGLPIETDFGECNFITVKEYPDYFTELNIMSLTKNHLVHKYSELSLKEKNPMLDMFIEEMKKLELFQLVSAIPELEEAYVRVLKKVFNDEEIIKKIDFSNFCDIRKLIMDMNGIKEEIINPNPEIQRAIERSKRVKSSDEKLEFSDIVSSVVGYNGLTYQDINEFTIYQLYMTYHRIAQIKNYDTSTLFATVAEKVQIDSWSKHINLFAEENHSITKEEFGQKSDGLFSK